MDEQVDQILHRGVKLLGESLVLPGFSLILDGQIKQGALHTGAGLLAKMVFGVPGLAVVAANAYSVSTTGKSLYDNLVGSKDARDYTLKDVVKQEVAAGLSLDEIQARVIEDIEDVYEETVATLQNQPPHHPEV